MSAIMSLSTIQKFFQRGGGQKKVKMNSFFLFLQSLWPSFLEPRSSCAWGNVSFTWLNITYIKWFAYKYIDVSNSSHYSDAYSWCDSLKNIISIYPSLYSKDAYLLTLKHLDKSRSLLFFFSLPACNAMKFACNFANFCFLFGWEKVLFSAHIST